MLSFINSIRNKLFCIAISILLIFFETSCKSSFAQSACTSTSLEGLNEQITLNSEKIFGLGRSAHSSMPPLYVAVRPPSQLISQNVVRQIILWPDKHSLSQVVCQEKIDMSARQAVVCSKSLIEKKLILVVSFEPGNVIDPQIDTTKIENYVMEEVLKCR